MTAVEKSNHKTIRALERGLHIMQILQEKRAATLNQVYQAADLPRPTILRILRTLESAGWVRRGLGDGLYRNSFKIKGMLKGLDDKDRLAEIAAPFLDILCREASWPSDLAVIHHEKIYMQLIETSRAKTPFLLKRDEIGHMINIPLSAMGRVYLAFCDQAERDDIINKLKKTDSVANRIVMNDKIFLNQLEKIKVNGYATREASFGGGERPLRSSYDDGLQAIAVPIQIESKVIGCVSLVWVRQAATIEEIVEKLLLNLKETADKIKVAYAT
jgi:IclR family transcriptional regulator, mhp operon transcriptional activator